MREPSDFQKCQRLQRLSGIHRGKKFLQKMSRFFSNSRYFPSKTAKIQHFTGKLREFCPFQIKINPGKNSSVLARVGLFFAGLGVFLYTGPRRCMDPETALKWLLMFCAIRKAPYKGRKNTRCETKNRGSHPRLQLISFIFFFAVTLFIGLYPDAPPVFVLPIMATNGEHPRRACMTSTAYKLNPTRSAF